jgi:hypothetical protein
LVDAQGLVDRRDWKKILMTTDTELIKDGVHPIGDEFLEWFVKNPSCEVVEVIKEDVEQPKPLYPNGNHKGERVWIETYKIIIPKEEPKQELERGITITHVGKPKQETLEEAAGKLSKNAYKKHSVKDDKLSLDEQIQRSGGFIVGFKEGMIAGAKWKAERMYSEEEVKQFAFECVANFLSNNDNKVEIKLVDVIIDRVNDKFEQFKNK